MTKTRTTTSAEEKTPMGHNGRKRGRGESLRRSSGDKATAQQPAGQSITVLSRPPHTGHTTPAASRQTTALANTLRALGIEVEMVVREVFDGTERLVPHVRHRPSAVRNANEEVYRQMSPLDHVAMFVTDRVGTFGFFLIIFVWTVIWLGWNILAPRQVRFDPAPAFVFWLFISNMIQLLLMPLLMVGQNLQGRHSEIRAQTDFEVNTKAEQEVEAILLHLEHQAAQIEQQGEVMLEVLHKLDTFRPIREQR